MSTQPKDDLLEALRSALRKIDADPAPRTPALSHLHSLLLSRIAELEATQMPNHPGRSHADQVS